MSPTAMPRDPVFRTARWILVVLLLLASAGTTTLASQSTPTSSPVAEDGTRLYVGHNAALTATIPAEWEPDRQQRYGYRGHDGFIDSWSLWVMNSSVDSIEAMCESIAAEPMYFGPVGEIEMTTWRGMPACEIRTAADEPEDPVALVFEHPAPREDSSNRYAYIVVDSAHFDAVIQSVSFDSTGITAEDYLEAALDLLEVNWLWRDEVDWDALRAETRAGAGDLSAPGDFSRAHSALSTAIARLAFIQRDPYAGFWRPQSADVRAPSSALIQPFGEKLPNGIGYLWVPTVFELGDEAVEYSETLHATIEGQRRSATCGWVVDLRGIAGGNIYAMWGGLAPLLEPGLLVEFRTASGTNDAIVMADDGTFTYGGAPLRWMTPMAAASGPVLREQPLAVLVDDETVSSGEALAITLASRDRTQVFGQTTYGGAMANIGLSLFDGAYFDFAVSWIAGPNGAIYPDGVVPDVEVTGGVTPSVEDDPVVEEAMAWLAGQPGCTGDTATPVE